jgi:hypothetical protein
VSDESPYEAPFSPNWFLDDARELVMLRRFAGVRCPCCDQYAMVYRRRLNVAMCRHLINLYKAGGTKEYVHSPTVLAGTRGEEARLSYWGLIEATPVPINNKIRGYWRVTREGELFLDGQITRPEAALVYNAHLLQLTGDPIDISAGLKRPFDLSELLKGD